MRILVLRNAVTMPGEHSISLELYSAIPYAVRIGRSTFDVNLRRDFSLWCVIGPAATAKYSIHEGLQPREHVSHPVGAYWCGKLDGGGDVQMGLREVNFTMTSSCPAPPPEIC